MKGEMAWFFAFDIANELVVEKAQQILGERASLYRPVSKHEPARALSIHPPLAVTTPPAAASVRGTPLSVDIRLYDFGAVSIILRNSFEVDELAGLSGLHDPRLDDGRRLDDLALAIAGEIAREIEPALVFASRLHEPESYAVFCIKDLGQTTTAERWIAERRRDIAGLLTAVPPERLSDSQIEEVFRYQRSLEKTDAVILGWDAALVVDVDGPLDEVLFTIELANLQLEEFRHMDRVLDQFMNSAYEDIERRTPSLFGTTATLRKLRWIRIDLAKLADEVTNITKLFGDWHLARVYLAARERFHLDRWRDSIGQRLGQLDNLYNLVHSELGERRMFLLEMLVVILIVLEIITGVWLVK